jgi:hypothetical protein
VLTAGSEVDTVVSVNPENEEVRPVKEAPDIAGKAPVSLDAVIPVAR